MTWNERVAPIGLSPEAADTAVQHLVAVERVFNDTFGSASNSAAWWVPGRIEVLGKHTDYAGGRSLLAAVERGFYVIASQRRDREIEFIDVHGARCSTTLTPDAATRPGEWSDYVIAVARRIARDFPDAKHGVNLAFSSTLPIASGLSSSSALTIGTLLPLIHFNQLTKTDTWRTHFTDVEALAEYAGAVENGRAFRNMPADQGVGTQGGSEDHTAILCCRAGELSQYRFIPVTAEANVGLDAAVCFVISMSGVHAAKSANARDRYNALARQSFELLAIWNRIEGRNDTSLLDGLQSRSDARDTLRAAIERSNRTDSAALLARLNQFADECLAIIPQTVEAIRRADWQAVGPLVARSQRGAELALQNQVEETIELVRYAVELGAHAASAFGAGFGGSVWALVPSVAATDFAASWQARYLKRFPQHAEEARFFRTRPGPPAQRLT